MGSKLLDKAIHVRMKYSHTALPRLLLILIANFADDETKISKISIYELGRLTGFAPETIEATLRDLDRAGYLEILQTEHYAIYKFYLRFFGEKFSDLQEAKSKAVTQEVKTESNAGYKPRWMPHCQDDAFYKEDLDVLSKHASCETKINTKLLMLLPTFISPLFIWKDKKMLANNILQITSRYSHQDDVIHDLAINAIERIQGRTNPTLLDIYLLGLAYEDNNKKKKCFSTVLNQLRDTLVHFAIYADENLNERPRWEIGEMQKLIQEDLAFKLEYNAKIRESIYKPKESSNGSER